MTKAHASYTRRAIDSLLTPQPLQSKIIQFLQWGVYAFQDTKTCSVFRSARKKILPYKEWQLWLSFFATFIFFLASPYLPGYTLVKIVGIIIFWESVFFVVSKDSLHVITHYLLSIYILLTAMEYKRRIFMYEVIPPSYPFYFQLADVCLFMLLLIILRKDTLKTSAFLPLLLLFFGIISISAFASMNLFSSFSFLLIISRGIITYIVLQNTLDNDQAIRVFFKALFFVSILICLFGITQYLSKNLLSVFYNVQHFDVTTPYFRITSAFGHPNQLAAFLVLAAIPASAFAFATFSPAIGVIAASLFTFTLILTFGRVGIASYFFGILLFLYLKGKILLSKDTIKIDYAIIPIILLCMILLLPALSERMRDSSLSETWDTRKNLIIEGSLIMEDFPFFGVGINAFGDFLRMQPYNLVGETIPFIHNELLHIGAEAGIFAMIILLFIVALPVLLAYSLLGAGENKRDLMSAALFCSVAAFNIFLFFEGVLFWDPFFHLFIAFMAILVTFKQNDSHSNPHSDSRDPKLSVSQ